MRKALDSHKAPGSLGRLTKADEKEIRETLKEESKEDALDADHRSHVTAKDRKELKKALAKGRAPGIGKLSRANEEEMKETLRDDGRFEIEDENHKKESPAPADKILTEQTTGEAVEAEDLEA